MIKSYAEVQEEERGSLYRDLVEKEETAMLAQYIRSKGFDEGIQQVIQQGLVEGISDLIEIKYGVCGKKIPAEIRGIHDADRLRQIKEAAKQGLSIQEIERMILH